MDENTTVKPGDGWVASGTPGGTLWLVEAVDQNGREAKLVRWYAEMGRGLARQVTHVSVDTLLRNDEPQTEWRRATDAEVENLTTRLMRSDAADTLQGIAQQVRERRVVEEGTAVDAEREAARTRGQKEREVATAVPALDKMLWKPGPPQTMPTAEQDGPEGARVSEREVRANAPMEERAGLTQPHKVQFPHDYPGAPGHNPKDPGDCFTTDCRYGCGCYAGPSTSGDRRTGVDPFGECPNHPELVQLKGSLAFRVLIEEQGMAPDDALRVVAGERDRRARWLRLSEAMDDVGSRMMYEARELRLLAGVTDEEYAAKMFGPPTTSD